MVKKETILAMVDLLKGMNRADWHFLRDAIEQEFHRKEYEVLRTVTFEATPGLPERIEKYCNE